MDGLILCYGNYELKEKTMRLIFLLASVVLVATSMPATPLKDIRPGCNKFNFEGETMNMAQSIKDGAEALGTDARSSVHEIRCWRFCCKFPNCDTYMIDKDDKNKEGKKLCRAFACRHNCTFYTDLGSAQVYKTSIIPKN